MSSQPWVGFIEEAADAGEVSADGRISGDLQKRLFIDIGRPMLRQFDEELGADAEERPALQAALMDRLLQMPMWGTFHKNGKPTWILDEEAVERAVALRAKDRMLASGRLPFGCFFIGWPGTDDTSIYWGEEDGKDFRTIIDGAFVMGAGGDKLAVMFTGYRSDGAVLDAPGPRLELQQLSGEPLVHWCTAFEPPAQIVGRANAALFEAQAERHAEASKAVRLCADRLVAALAVVQATSLGRASNQGPQMEPSRIGASDVASAISALPVWEGSLSPIAIARRVEELAGNVRAIAGSAHYGKPIDTSDLDALREALVDSEPLRDAVIDSMGNQQTRTDELVLALKAAPKLKADAATAVREWLHSIDDSESVALVSAIESSRAALDDHSRSFGATNEQTGMKLDAYKDGERWRVEVRLIGPSPVGGFVWDHILGTTMRPAAVLIACMPLVSADIRLEYGRPKTSRKPLPPLVQYHPVRFEYTRDYARPLAELVRTWSHRSRLGSAEEAQARALADMQETMTLIMREQQARGSVTPLRGRVSSNPFLAVNAEIDLCEAYKAFVLRGRQIFDFPKRMVDEFARTDVDQIPCNLVKLPYDSQYVYFGPRPDLEIEPGWLADGAYVTGSEGEYFSVTVTASPSDPDRLDDWATKGEPRFTQMIGREEMGMSLGEAIDVVLSRRLAELAEKRARGDRDVTNDLKAAMLDSGVEGQLPARQIIQPAKTNADAEESELRARLPVYSKALNIVVNALCYVTAYGEDIETRHHKKAPPQFVDQLQSKSPKQRDRAESKLESLGYRTIHFCGQHFMQQLSDAELTGEQGPQLRRGHWKRIPFGPGHSLRRLGWIRPYKTHPEKGEPDAGRIYLVDDKSSRKQ